MELGTGGTYLGGPGSPSHQDACLLWALRLASPLPPLRPLVTCDLVCPYDFVCVLLCLLPFSISPSFLLSLSAPSFPQDHQKHLSLPFLKLPPAKTPSTCQLKAAWPYSGPLLLGRHRGPCAAHRGALQGEGTTQAFGDEVPCALCERPSGR